MIEAGIVGKSVLTILAPQFAQETTLHFHYLLAENGGFVHVAASLPEHVAQLAEVVGGGHDDDQRREFVELRAAARARPAGDGDLRGCGRGLASLKPGPPQRGSRALRAVLGVEAWLSSLGLSGRARVIRRKSRPAGETSLQ